MFQPVSQDPVHIFIVSSIMCHSSYIMQLLDHSRFTTRGQSAIPHLHHASCITNLKMKMNQKMKMTSKKKTDSKLKLTSQRKMSPKIRLIRDAIHKKCRKAEQAACREKIPGICPVCASSMNKSLDPTPISSSLSSFIMKHLKLFTTSFQSLLQY